MQRQKAQKSPLSALRRTTAGSIWRYRLVKASAVIKDACDLIAKETVKSDCKVVIAFSSVADAILSTADKEKSTLIVMGSKGLSQSSRFKMGSVASQVVKYSDCSVYVVKMAG